MANRAYLYFVESQERLTKSQMDGYLDSRNNIPFVWWFLFRRDSVNLEEVQVNKSRWNEIWLSIEWQVAHDLFNKRIPDIVRLGSGLITAQRLQEFIQSLSADSKKYLVLDPDEIFQDDGNSDEIRTREILGLVDDCDETRIEEIRLIDFYSRHIRPLTQEQAELCILGYSYPKS